MVDGVPRYGAAHVSVHCVSDSLAAGFTPTQSVVTTGAAGSVDVGHTHAGGAPPHVPSGRHVSAADPPSSMPLHVTVHDWPVVSAMHDPGTVYWDPAGSRLKSHTHDGGVPPHAPPAPHVYTPVPAFGVSPPEHVVEQVAPTATVAGHVLAGSAAVEHEHIGVIPVHVPVGPQVYGWGDPTAPLGHATVHDDPGATRQHPVVLAGAPGRPDPEHGHEHEGKGVPPVLFHVPSARHLYTDGVETSDPGHVAEQDCPGCLDAHPVTTVVGPEGSDGEG